MKTNDEKGPAVTCSMCKFYNDACGKCDLLSMRVRRSDEACDEFFGASLPKPKPAPKEEEPFEVICKDTNPSHFAKGNTPPNKAPVIDGKKKCSKCGRMLPLEAFNRAARGSGGRQNVCRECMKNYNHERNKMKTAQKTVIEPIEETKPISVPKEPISAPETVKNVPEKPANESANDSANAPIITDVTPRLTTTDIRNIVKIADRIIDKMTARELLSMGEEGYYQKVLEIYNIEHTDVCAAK